MYSPCRRIKISKVSSGKQARLIPAALRLDPDEVDKRDTDCNDYRVFQGRQFRVSAKDEAAFEQLRLLKLAATTRRTKRSRVVIDYSENEEGKNEEMTEKLKKAEQERAIAAEKRRKAADEKKKATWNANGENMNRPLVANGHASEYSKLLLYFQRPNA
ncbi:hypothetical protein OSTOST_05835 [Ostertagia ostertagi]